MGLAVFSFGGGVQSTAALVLAARGELPVDAMLFANVGDDSENPDTLRYVREVAMPYAKMHGVPLHELCKMRRVRPVTIEEREALHHAAWRRSRETGEHIDVASERVGRWEYEPETLYQRLTRPGSRSIGIPVRLKTSGAPANRACTQDFKIRVIAKWCWQHGARKTSPATTMLGISLDEFQRMRNDSGISYTRLAYPLIERRMSRQDCINAIARAGLPIPPKSSCWFCPYHRMSAWREMRDREPELFAKACDLEARLMARKRAIIPRPNDACYFTDRLKPLARAVGDAVQPALLDVEDACESGFCMV